MTRHTYDIGTQVSLTASFEDPIKGEVVKPSVVKCTVLTGDRKTLTPEVKEEGSTFQALVDIDASGYWHYAFDGLGGFKASAEGRFEVREQKVPR